MTERRLTGRRGTSGFGVRLAASLLLCALTLGAKQYCPEAAQTMRPWLIGRSDNRVVMAFSALGGALEQGGGLGRAVQAFCAEMSGDGLS